MSNLPNRAFSQKAVASLLGFTEKKIVCAVRRGCPFDWCSGNYGGKKKRFDLCEVRMWCEYRSRRKSKRFATGTTHDPRPGVIYALFDPRSNAVRYVGKTGCKVSDRFTKHLSDAVKYPHRRTSRWINRLKADGLKPGIRVLQECLPGMLDACEREWIARGKAKGWKLTNATDGGELGVKNEDVCKRIADISREAWKRPEYQERHRAAREKQERERAGRLGLTVEQYRERKKQGGTEAGRAKWAADMAIHARRVREAEERKRWVWVPLTHKRTAFVHLTRGKSAVIDLVDWDRVGAHMWSCQYKAWAGNFYYRAKTNIRKRLTLLNRFVVGATSRQMVRHRNGDQLDCRRRNLLVEQCASECGRAVA